MFLSSCLKIISLILATAFLPTAALAAHSVIPTKPVEIHLDSEVKVGGDEVVLGDVATIYARSMHDFKALAGLVVSKIPDDKQEVRLPASYLEARVRAVLPPSVEFTLRAPKEIVFRLERLGISSQEIAAEILRLGRAAGKIPGNVEVEVQPLSGMDQLAGYKLANTSIDPAGEMKQWKGEMSFKLAKADGKELNAAPIWVRAKLRWFQPAWVASRALLFTESPEPAHFTLGKVETTRLREDPVAASPEELGLFLKNARIKRAIAANSPLFPSMLDRRPDAAAGSLLRVVFVSESGVRVSADGSLISQVPLVPM